MSKKGKDPWYRQCRYQTLGPLPRKVGVSWIPEDLAKVGRKIYFGKKDQPTEERELWEVLEVWGRQPESYLVEHQMDYKHQREQSDV